MSAGKPISDFVQLPLFDAIVIKLTKGYETIIDPVDADLMQYRWYVSIANRHGLLAYAISHRDDSFLALHRVILECMLSRPLVKGEMVDHMDGDGLNNRRANLRLATRSQNNQNTGLRRCNTSGYKGVSFSKGMNKWLAQIGINGRKIPLGYFDTPEQAYAVYCEAAKRLHKEFARLS